MSRLGLVLASLRHHRRAALGVALGFALSAAVLCGALFVGDSVRASLARRAVASIGRVEAALVGGERSFRAALADELGEGVTGARVAPLWRLPAVATVPGGGRRANEVALHGIDARFFALAPEPEPRPVAWEQGVLLSLRLARQLEVEVGDTVLLRVAKPSALPRDMVLATTDDDSVALRLTVTGALDEGAFGRFSLAASPLPPLSAFVDLGRLQRELGLDGRANLLLADGPGGAAALAEQLDQALAQRFELADAELELRPREAGCELGTARVFLDDAVVAAAARVDPGALGALTYFVNELRKAERATPYSMVTGLGALEGGAPPAWLPDDLAADELCINDWLAEDLGAATGDALTLRYFVPGPDRALLEAERELRVRAVLPLSGPAADPSLMPPFPGLADADHCRDWEAGIPIDYERVRDHDEEYWETHRGTPKAFVTLATARELWSNRWGSLTAVRFAADAAAVGERLRTELAPADLGLFFADVRTPVLAGGATATDFGGLFLGLSSFLIGAALALTALLFGFGVEQRAPEIGLLLAVGYRPRDVRWLLLGEAAFLALVGTAIGGLVGTFYTRLVLRGLAGVWSDAVAGAAIEYHASPSTLAIGLGASFLTAVAAAALALRRALRRRPLELLSSSAGLAAPVGAARGARAALIVGLLAVAGALALSLVGGDGSGSTAAGRFFGAGALLLVGGLALARAVIARSQGSGAPARSVAGLGRTNVARRPGRSLATVGLFAAGAFLVLSIGVHRRSGAADAAGTGGFALFGQASLPIFEDLDGAAGREAYGLDDDELSGVSVLALRLREGDDASCLNLGAPQHPRLLGVDPSALEERDAFHFVGALDGADPGWSLLDLDLADDVVPAVADASSARWTMKKALGEDFEYTDERGATFRVRLVGLIEDSILQGHLVVSEARFRARFPSEPGARVLLIDAPAERAAEVSLSLTRALSDVGLELEPAARRLDAFNAVQNGYLDVFQVLGGLGLVLGSAGLGVVVLRNALERRRELAVLRAVGFTGAAVRRLLVAEHLLLFGLGLGAGVAAALLAVLPAGGGASLGAGVPLVLAIAASGGVWVLVAGALAARGPLVAALRDE